MSTAMLTWPACWAPLLLTWGMWWGRPWAAPRLAAPHGCRWAPPCSGLLRRLCTPPRHSMHSSSPPCLTAWPCSRQQPPRSSWAAAAALRCRPPRRRRRQQHATAACWWRWPTACGPVRPSAASCSAGRRLCTRQTQLWRRCGVPWPPMRAPRPAAAWRRWGRRAWRLLRSCQTRCRATCLAQVGAYQFVWVRVTLAVFVLLEAASATLFVLPRVCWPCVRPLSHRCLTYCPTPPTPTCRPAGRWRRGAAGHVPARAGS